ncbi:2-succinyl-5-enolpyruvyl-6-hydroxy-3-cyclohexene-1-carboxylic-acid synthase [Parendozoicomonas haliclonae]|uniref:2-succinyl-5-enolpyruvyl-6-hydroxy-3- cyclohexene-1-carboxylic-acid synthase n=1 Tax=Parendozoicomonas haliclonae TaxID=1960125 RepID=UPI000B35ABCD|nr:2-succinyl-5-enolpyruvyl-6-hydroxy-3-cyclohexene-1-carboxylic-acid synthase [Parendozoicomonas haliclonae]
MTGLNLSVNNRPTDLTSLWCDLIFEELYRCGIRHICLAPGSRSAPLALAAERHSNLQVHVHFDERGLGFYSLGLARETGSPVVVITTSGTAVANLAPAVHEARESGVSLLLLTADRPAELLGCGANQTLAQPGIFGEAAARTFQVPVPDTKLPARWLLQMLDEAVALARQPDTCVVHINQALREPLYGQGSTQSFDSWLQPVEHWLQVAQPLCEWMSRSSTIPSLPAISEIRVIVLAGQLRHEERDAVLELVKRTGWLLVADIQSGLHGHSLALPAADMAYAHGAVQELLNQSHLVIQVGRRVLSKAINTWLAHRAITDHGHQHWYVDERSDRHDPNFSVTHRFSLPVAAFCRSVQAPAGDQSWWNALMQLGGAIAEQINLQLSADTSEARLSEIDATRALHEALCAKQWQKRVNLFIGNSMPIRYLDSLSTVTSEPWLPVWSNRGISGIDGLIATACGHSAGSQRKTVLLIGDLSFLHDLNSLALVREHQLLVVLINNSGGSIFNLFPVPEPAGQKCFRVEHDFQGQYGARMFGLHYTAPSSIAEYDRALESALASSQGAVIEVICPPDEATNRFVQVLASVKAMSFDQQGNHCVH